MNQQQDPHPEGDTATGGPHYGDDVCPDCSGTGTLDDATCPTCGGTGRVLEPIYEE